MEEKRCAVVTGGNKGIGFEICRQLALTGIEVILTSRNELRGVEAVEKLNSSGLSNVMFHQLDITDSSSIARLRKFIESRFRKLDILVNNAAEIGIIMREEFRAGGGFAQEEDALTNVIHETYELGEKCLNINYYGTKEVTEALIPLIELSKSPRIVNVTSNGGDLKRLHNEKLKEELQDIEKLTEERIDEIIKWFLSDFKNANVQENGWPSAVSAYSVSKIALNAYTRLMARKFKNIIVTVSPRKIEMMWHVKYPTSYAPMEEKRCAVVTGGNKGIGFEICRQLALTGIEVILTSRNELRGVEAVEKLNSSGLSNVMFHQLDITDSSSIARLRKFIESRFRKLDILVNNAAEIGIIMHEEFRAGGGFNWNVTSNGGDLKRLHNEKLKEELQDIEKLTEERIDEIIKWFLSDFKNANVQENGWPSAVSAYSVSKIALNAYTRLMARKFKNIIVNCVHPGYVVTDMTSQTGYMTVEEGAKGPVMAALLPDGGPSGVYFNQTQIAPFASPDL
ncbi:glucose/ribitol dehydrogenase [Tanacetum coccineum]